MFQRIDLETWDRRAVFEEFIGLDCSYSLTWQVDITALHRYRKEKGLRFYPTFTWCVLTAINRHKEFRMGYDEHGNVGYYDRVHPEYTVLHPRTRNMESLNTEYDRGFHAFYRAMTADMECFQREERRTPPREDYVLVSCVPWYSYTALSFHMKSQRSFLRPMLVWGKYEERDGKILLPLTIQVHHAAADGYHCHLLLEELEKLLDDPEAELML